MTKYMNEKILCEFYELFYWKELDVNNPNIILEVHSMMRFLFRYGIDLSNYGFSIDSTVNKFPYNEEIQELIDSLKTINQEEIKDVELNKYAITKIQIASIMFHEKAKECGIDFNDFIISVAKIIHVNEQVMPEALGDKIATLDYINEDEETINSVLELVKNIDADIKKYAVESKDNL